MNKKLLIHPDALYDSIYEEKELETDDYVTFLPEYKGEYRTENGVVIITVTGHCLIIENCFDNTIRFRITKQGVCTTPTVTEQFSLINTDWGKRGYDYRFENNRIEFSNVKMIFTYDFTNGEFGFKTKDGKTLVSTKDGGVRFGTDSADYSGMRTFTAFKRIDNEKFSGFGARMYSPDRTGECADIFSQKGGAKVGDYGGFPVPYFISSRGYGLFFNNPWPHMYFDMAKSDSSEWFVNSPGGDYDIFVFSGSAAEIIKSYTDIVGRNQTPQKWLMGYWCSSIRFDESKNAIEDMTRMRDEGYPCDAIVIDGPWRGGKNFIKDYNSGWGYPSDDYNWHKDFGDGPGMIKELEEKNIKTVLHINSCAFKSETAVPAIAKGLLRQINSETVPDVATERGIEFYKNFITPRIKEGVKQWWTDHSDRVSGEVCNGIPSRNLFGVLWNKAITEIMEENGVPNHMSLSRGGGIGSPRYALPWAGDTEFGIHRFKEDLWYIMNAGMAGFTLCGYDLGGFMRRNKKVGDADAEQFDIDNICRRVCQSMIFCPMPRMHNGDSAKPKWPWNCPEETRELYKECLNYRYRFIPNIYSYALHGSRTGEPIIRPMYYYGIDNEFLYSLDDQFYMGENILIAPITEKNVNKREVYLPEGEWVNVWTKEKKTGGKYIICRAPLFKKEGLPMFVRLGSGIAYQPQCMSLEDTIPDALEIELYADKYSELILHEGASVTNKFSCRVIDNTISVYAENNTDSPRKYSFAVYANGKCYKKEYKADARTVIEGEI